VLAVVALLLAATWIASSLLLEAPANQPGEPTAPAPVATGNLQQASDPGAEPAEQASNEPAIVVKKLPAPVAVRKVPSDPIPSAADGEITAVLTDDTLTFLQSADRLVTLAARKDLPEASRLEALEHALHLVDDDEEYAEHMLPLIRRSDLPAALHEAVDHDLYKRNPSTLLRMSLEILKMPLHPLRDNARESLEFFLDEELGNNYAAWQREIERFLREEEADSDP